MHSGSIGHLRLKMQASDTDSKRIYRKNLNKRNVSDMSEGHDFKNNLKNRHCRGLRTIIRTFIAGE